MSVKRKFNRIRRFIRRHAWILTVIGFACMSPVYWAKATQFVHCLVGFF
jgi:hypothetical protein